MLYCVREFFQFEGRLAPAQEAWETHGSPRHMSNYLRFGDHNRVAQEIEHANKRLAFRLTQARCEVRVDDIQGIEQLCFREDEATRRKPQRSVLLQHHPCPKLTEECKTTISVRPL